MTAVMMSGCGSKDAVTKANMPTYVDTPKLETAFKSSDNKQLKIAVDNACVTFNTQDNAGGISQLQSIEKQYQLTADEKAAVDQAIATAQKIMAGKPVSQPAQ